ncbi:MAG: DUF2141 domain-containing protein [Chlorobi bacterium]|nr:DUF2141 domain-containing protein [Chlorobiota bacterium]
MRTLFLLVTILAIQYSYSQTADLSLTVTGFETISGTINIGLYNKADDFPEENKEYKLIIEEVRDKEFTYTFKDLPLGEYAIALYHDENKDDECNRNFLGIPKEGYGFSKNFKPVFSAPSFDDTKFSLTENKSITINLIY